MVTLYKVLRGHNGAVYTLRAGNTPSTFLSGGAEGWLAQWHETDDNGTLLNTFESSVLSIAVNIGTEGKYDAVGTLSGGLHFIDAATREPLRSVQAHSNSTFALLAPNPETLYTLGGDGRLAAYALNTFRAAETLHLASKALRTIAARVNTTNSKPTSDAYAIGASDGNVYLLSMGLEVVDILEAAHLPSVFAVAYSHDGQQLATAGRDAKLNLWNAETRTLEYRLDAHLATINAVAFSPDGRWLATASRDRSLRIWDARTSALLKVIDARRYGFPLRSANCLLWRTRADDGTTQLLTGCDDGLILVFSIDDI